MGPTPLIRVVPSPSSRARRPRPEWLALGSILLVVGGTGCRGEGTWSVTATGGDYLQTGMGSEAFDDDCAAVFDRLELGFQSAELFDADGESGGGIEVPSPLDLTGDGPHTVGIIEVLEGEYDTMALQLGTGASPAIRISGVLTCSSGTADFDWSFEGPLRLSCDTDVVGIDNKGEDETLLVVTPDAVFAGSSPAEGAERRGLHLRASDSNLDGVITLQELAALTGPDVGLDTVPGDLRTYVTGLAENMVAVEGGSPCVGRGG